MGGFLQALFSFGHLADGTLEIILAELLRRLVSRLLGFGDRLGLRLGLGLFTEGGGNFLLLLLEHLLQASRLIQFRQGFVHLLLGGGDGFGCLGELRCVVGLGLAQFLGELLLLLIHGVLGRLQVRHGLGLIGASSGSIGLVQVGLGIGHVLLRRTEISGGFRGKILGLGLGGFRLGGEVALLLGSLRGRLVVGLLGGLGGVRGDLLLILHQLANLLAQFVELGEILLGLLQLGDLGVDLLRGLFERVLGRLLGHRRVGLVLQRLLRFLHLAGGFAQGLGGLGGVGGGGLLGLLGLGLDGLLLGRLFAELLGLLLGGGRLLGLGGIVLDLLLLLGELLDFLLQLFQLSDLVLRLLLLSLRDGNLLLQSFLGLLHFGERLLLLLRGSGLLLGRAAAGRVLQHRAGLLLLLDGGLQLLGRLGCGLLDVLPDRIRLVHDLGLLALGLGGLGLFRLGLGGFLGLLVDLLLLLDGLLQITHGLPHHLQIVAGGHEQLGQVLKDIPRPLLVAGGGQQIGRLQVAGGGGERGRKAGFLGLGQGDARTLGGRAIQGRHHFFQLCEDDLGLVANGALLGLLKLKRHLMRRLRAAGVTALGEGGQTDGFLEIVPLTAGQRGEARGNFL